MPKETFRHAGSAGTLHQRGTERVICIVSHFYAPVSNPPANRMEALVGVLAKDRSAEEIRVVTGRPNYPDGKLAAGYRFRLWRKRKGEHGERILNLYEFPSPNRGRLRKTAGYLSFAAATFLYFLLRRIRVDDTIYVTSPPLFPLLAVSVIRRFKRFRLILDIRDLWPDAVAGMGYIDERSWSFRFLKRMVDAAYARADHVVTVEEGGYEAIKRRLGPERVSMVRNPVDMELFSPQSPEAATETRAAWPDLFQDGHRVFIYCGTFAHYSGLLEAMEGIRIATETRRDFRFVLIGQGELEPEIRSRRDAYGLGDVVVLLPFQPKSVCVDLINAADACFAALTDQPIYECATPTKVLEYLSCGKQVLACLDGPFAERLRKEDLATVVPRARPERLAAEIVRLSSSEPLPDSRRRRFIADRFSVDAFAQGILKVLR